MLKRAIDIFASLGGLILFSPLFAILMGAALFSIGHPIFFSQDRPGLRGAIFKLYKFRSMRIAHDREGRPLEDAERLTRFGSFLRRTSLDELPGLWNVLRGDMSLVGPRPLLVEYLPLYSAAQARRHEVRPGITGWAQVNGRNALSWERKFELDIWYVDNRSILMDIKIIGLTFCKVFLRDGISAPGEATMSRFLGSRNEGK